ncbi:MAG: FUSC family protein [Caulobacteraceae bacterium]
MTASLSDRGGRWVATHRAELRQCLRMTLAAILTMALGELFGMPRGYWAVLTAVIVTQANVGGSIKATLDRLIGTLAGAIYGGAVALLIPAETPVMAVVAVAVALGAADVGVGFESELPRRAGHRDHPATDPGERAERRARQRGRAHRGDRLRVRGRARVFRGPCCRPAPAAWWPSRPRRS